MERYDVIVIGGGPGGYVAAIKAAQLKLKTAIVEKESLGGVCLNWGCIPTKSLLRNAEIISNFSKGDLFGFDIDISKVNVSYAKAQQRSRQVSAKLVAGIDYLIKKNAIKAYKDEAVFADENSLTLKKSKEKIAGENIIIATGGKPVCLSGLDYSAKNVLNYKDALSLKEQPNSILIIGAGAIGIEFAAIWNAYGSKITIVEMLDSVLPNEDKDISETAQKALKKKGIKVLTNTKLMSVTNDGNKIISKLQGANGITNIETEYILVSAGIKPNTEGLNLNKINVNLDGRGYIKVNEKMQTNIDGIYAIGDVTGLMQLAHVASAQGIIAAKTIAKKLTQPIVYENIPKCTYGNPETASVGLTEQQACDRSIEYKTGVFPLSANGKAIAYGEPEGFIKIISGVEYGDILGVHMIGPHVTEMIASMVGLIKLEGTIDELSEIIYPHPTISESIMEAAHVVLDEGIHI